MKKRYLERVLCWILKSKGKDRAFFRDAQAFAHFFCRLNHIFCLITLPAAFYPAFMPPQLYVRNGKKENRQAGGENLKLHGCISIFRLKMSVFRLKIHIFRLDFSIFSLKTEFYPACANFFIENGKSSVSLSSFYYR